MSYEISIMPYASSNFSSDYDSITPDDNIPAPEIYYYENPDNEDTHSEIYTLLDHSIAEANDDGFYVFKEVAKPETMYVPDIQYNGLRNEYEWIYFKKTNFGLFEFLKELWVDNELEKKQLFDQSDLENGEIVNYPVLVVESNGIQEISFKNQNGDPIREYSGISTITDANGEVKIKVQYEKELGRDYIISATIDNGKQSDLMTINPDIVRVDSTTVKNGKVTVAIDGTSTKIIMLTKEGEAPDISGQRITDIAAGYSHSAAITEDGYLYTWGSNDKGQLGDGTTTSSRVPVLIPLDGKKAVSVSAGTEFTAAITEDGSLYMWGANDRGQLGDGSTTNSSTPRLIDIDGKKVRAVSLGYLHTAAITEDGSLYTWGANGKGQLGDGSVTAKSTPVRITLGSGESVSRVSAGNYHTAAVTESGSLYVWGANDFSQMVSLKFAGMSLKLSLSILKKTLLKMFYIKCINSLSAAYISCNNRHIFNIRNC